MPEAGVVFDVSGPDFDRAVIAASHERPVIVDFWAPWCGPCRLLGPALERVVGSFGAQAVLAKVNVDQNPDLAARFMIRGIPAVKVFRGGKEVGGFVGALPEPEILRQLRPFLPSDADRLVAEAEQAASQGKSGAADSGYREALKHDPSHPRANLRLAEAAIRAGDLARARELLARARPDPELAGDVEAAQARIWLAERCTDSGLLDACRQRLQRDPQDLQARLYLGCCLALSGEYRAALDELLAVVRADRNFQEGAAKEAMLRIFAIAGPASDLTREYRRLLSRELYV